LAWGIQLLSSRTDQRPRLRQQSRPEYTIARRQQTVSLPTCWRNCIIHPSGRRWWAGVPAGSAISHSGRRPPMEPRTSELTLSIDDCTWNASRSTGLRRFPAIAANSPTPPIRPARPSHPAASGRCTVENDPQQRSVARQSRRSTPQFTSLQAASEAPLHASPVQLVVGHQSENDFALIAW